MHLPDQAPALLRDGYLFAGRLRDRLPDDADPDAIRMRLLGRPALLVRGPDAVRFFTDTAVVRRHGALPGVVASVLFGQGAVHGLDDAEHLQRKAMFVTIIDAAAVHRLVASVDDAWRDQLAEWERDGAGSVYDGAVHVFGRSVLGWAGVPATPTQAQAVARDLATIVDGFGVLGPAHLKARRARHRSDTWATRLISQARTGVPEADRDSPLATVAGWRDVHGVSCCRCTRRLWSCRTCCAPPWRWPGSPRSPPWPCTSTPGGANAWRSRTPQGPAPACRGRWRWHSPRRCAGSARSCPCSAP